MATTTKGRKSGKGRKGSAEQRAAKREKVSGLMNRLESEVEKLATKEGWAAMVQTVTQSNIGRYSFNNQLLLLSQAEERGIPLSTVYGFKTWQNLGRVVRKGEKGLMLLAPREILLNLDDQDNEEQDGQDRQGEIIELPDGTRKRRTVTFRVTYVWDINQTDGIETVPTDGNAEETSTTEGEAAPSDTRPSLAGTSLDDLRTKLETQITAHGYEVRYEPTRRSNVLGLTVPALRTVTIRPDLDPAESVAAVAHELAHLALGHAEPSYDYHDTRNRAEIEAESVAYVLLAAADVEVPKSLPEYVASWTRDMDEVRAAAETVTRTAVHLLDAMTITATESAETSETPLTLQR